MNKCPLWKVFCRWLFVAIFLLCAWVVNAQQLSREEILGALEKDGCLTLEAGKVKICQYDYQSNNQNVEAISFQPPGSGAFPALVLIPGFQRSAADYISLALLFAKEGFAAVAITQPGWGKSEGQSDFVGPRTIKALLAGIDKFKREPFVDKKRLGIFGYSRGAMAASLIAVQSSDLRAAVFGGGIYDFKKAYEEIPFAGIKKNMEQQAGLTEKAFKERSSVLQINNLRCPVLILHGEKDGNAPVSQAYLLRDRLTELKKEFEIKIFPDKGHSLGMEEVFTHALDFFKRKLAANETSKKPNN
jgi:dipeptidyl aminopeptidase/acylaminoacyl peptidase